MRAPVSACIIARDDARVEQAVASVRPFVEQVVVVDTGSTTSLPYLGWGVDVVAVDETCNDEHGRIEDFSRARSASFALASAPWVLWLDSDDVVAGAEHLAEVVREAERARGGKAARVLARYEYAYGEDGEPSIVQLRERLVTRGDFEWRRRVHEGLVPREGVEAVDLATEKLVWRHLRGRGPSGGVDSAGRNERILRATPFAERDDRWFFDLGVEASLRAASSKDGDERDRAEADAEECLLRACSSSDRVLRSLACLRRAEALERRALHASVVREDPAGCSSLLALAESSAAASLAALPDFDAPRFLLARLAYVAASAPRTSERDERAALRRAVRFAEEGLALPEPKHPHPHDPRARAVQSREILHDSLARLGRLPEALAAVEGALLGAPGAPHLIAARREYRSRLARAEAARSLDDLLESGGVDAPTYEILRRGVAADGSLRADVRRAAEARLAAEGAAASIVGRRRVVFACPRTPEPWDPSVLAERGLGGSETAVVEVARRLAARGCDVRVYGSPTREGEFDGVRYLRAGKVFASEPCDVLVAWRSARLLEPEEGPASVGARLLWVHDSEAAAFTTARGLRASRVLALSRWHAEHLARAHLLHPSHVATIRNGVDVERFVERPDRDERRVVFSSSPDRGLDLLLDVWPSVLARAPGATLDVFYGFDGWRSAARAAGDARMEREADRLEARLDAAAPLGVRKRGRVDQATLAREMLSAGVWAHPSVFRGGAPFFETSCISAMEAQLAGLRVVAGAHGALPETVRYGVLVEGAGEEDLSAYALDFEDALAAAILGESSSTLRETIQVDARRRFDWGGVVDSLESLFETALLDAADGLLPAYAGAAQ